MSYLEIHNDKVHDLINPGNEEYDVHEDENHNFYVKGLSHLDINDYHDF